MGFYKNRNFQEIDDFCSGDVCGTIYDYNDLAAMAFLEELLKLDNMVIFSADDLDFMGTNFADEFTQNGHVISTVIEEITSLMP